jgi:hypothetical protein
MRSTLLAVLLVFTACATTEQKPAAPAPAKPEAKAEPAKPAEAPKAEAPKTEAPKAEAAKPEAAAAIVTVEFTSATATKAGGTLSETNYSERPEDSAITAKKFEAGVVTWVGQVGFGHGSSWAGIGFGAPIKADNSGVDASAAKTVTFRLASKDTKTLRLRITGADPEIQKAGCYPIVMQNVSAEEKEYVIPVSKFSPEGWCAGKARSVKQTLPQLTGFEIADIAIQKAPTSFSVGTITVQ